MKMRMTARLAVLAIAATTLGCTSTMVAKLNGLNSYKEFEKDGRIYVLSSNEAIKEFKDSGSISISKTRIGAGPKGETVVIDAGKKDNVRDEELWMMFKKNHGMQ